jgi:hypothetical protein
LIYGNLERLSGQVPQGVFDGAEGGRREDAAGRGSGPTALAVVFHVEGLPFVYEAEELSKL